MGKTIVLLAIVLSVGAGLLPAQAPPSLGDLARQIREQRDKDAKKAARVFTNDNLPAPTPGEPVSQSPLPPPPPATKSDTAATVATKPAPAAHGTGSTPSTPAAGQAQTRDYWQEKFKQARQDVAHAKELQQLSEDELNLLQIQQVREIDADTKAILDAKVQAKQSQVDLNRATTEAAQKNLDDLEKAFKESAAPEEWSQTEPPPA
jgi:hypothetical protein